MNFHWFFPPRKSISVRKIVPSWLRLVLVSHRQLFSELLLIMYVLIQKYLFIMILCKWLSSVKEIKWSCLCYWECENDYLFIGSPTLESFGLHDWWQNVWLLKINDLFSLFASLTFNWCFYLYRVVKKILFLN